MKRMFLCAALVLPIACAANLPELKEGLWSVHSQSIDNPGNKKTDETYTLCRNHAYDLSAQALAKSVKGCTTISENLQGGNFSAELRCEVAGTVIDTKEKATFQGDTSYHSEAHATYTPTFYGTTESTMVVDQKYVGSCPAGAQPGDRTDAKGRVTHSGLGKH